MSPRECHIIFGCKGQDGQLLTESLLRKGKAVVGVSRDTVQFLSPDPMHNGVEQPRGEYSKLLSDYSPAAIHYLAASHSSAESNHSVALSGEDFGTYFRSNTNPYISLLEACKRADFDGPIFFASSSQVFSPESGSSLDEESPYNPTSLYGMAKAQCTWVGRKYREEHSMQIYTGILFNHESHLRSGNFLTSKIARTARRAAEGSEEILEIGDLSGEVDWSLAPDFVEGFQRLVDSGQPGEYIFASGRTITVGALVEAFFSQFGLAWDRYVVENPSLIHGKNSSLGIARVDKLKSVITWEPDTSLERLVRGILRLDFEMFSSGA